MEVGLYSLGIRWFAPTATVEGTAIHRFLVQLAGGGKCDMHLLFVVYLVFDALSGDPIRLVSHVSSGFWSSES